MAHNEPHPLKGTTMKKFTTAAKQTITTGVFVTALIVKPSSIKF